MPFYPTDITPNVPVRSFRSLVFDPSLEIILESPAQVKKGKCCDIACIGSVSNIDSTLLHIFLKQSRGKGRIQVTNTLTLDLESKTIFVKGYELSSFGGGQTFLCSSQSSEMHRIPYTFSNEKVIATLEYLYHMITCV